MKTPITYYQLPITNDQLPTASPRRAFTTIELMVAMTILALMLTAMATIWSTQQTVIQLSGAQTEVSPYARSIESNLHRDLAGLSRDGFMVISSNSANGYYFDQLLFFANGLKSSAMPNSGNSALTSRVWYGHLKSTLAWGGGTNLPDPSQPTWKLSLGRQDLLLDPGDTTAGAPTSILDPTNVVATDQFDFAATDLFTIKQGIFTPSATTVQIGQNMANACFRIGATWPFDAKTINTNGIMPIHALLAPYCSSFRVQFAGRYNTAVTPAGQVDVYTTTGPNLNQIIWYDGLNNHPTFPAGNSQVVNGNACVFSPDQPDLWPTLIQVTVNLQDSAGRFHDRYVKGVRSVDGYQYSFIVKLP